MRTRLIDLLLWALAKLGVRMIPIPAGLDALIVEAKGLCGALDRYKEAGEWKRMQAYARLLKRYPATSKRDVAMAIELAVRSL